jgi:chromosome partitioning protein
MIISIANHKGGTGKTTTVVNIGSALQSMGKKVLLIDFDPQGNLSYSLGINDFEYTSADWIMGNISLEDVAFEASNIHIIPANVTLNDSAYKIQQINNSDFLLKKALESVNDYDFILIDCPPTLSVYTMNALNASDGVLIPIKVEALSIQGLEQIVNTIDKIKTTTNFKLKIIGILGVLVDGRRQLTNEVIDYIKSHFSINIFDSYVRNSVKTAEAPSFAKSVIEYAPDSNSAKDYLSVTDELLSKIISN